LPTIRAPGIATETCPEILFLDGVFTALERHMRDELMDVLVALRDRGDAGSVYTASEVFRILNRLGVSSSAITTRPPILDDVCLQVTGNRLDEIAA
jgi:hypothetical protein